MTDNTEDCTDQACKGKHCPRCGRHLPEPGTLFDDACGTCRWGTEDGGGVPCGACGTVLDPYATFTCCNEPGPDMATADGRAYFLSVQPGHVVTGLFVYLTGMAADDHPVDPEELAVIETEMDRRDLLADPRLPRPPAPSREVHRFPRLY